MFAVIQGSHSSTPVKSGDVQLLEVGDTNPLQGPGQSPTQEKLGWRRLVSATPEFRNTGRYSLQSPGVCEGKATSEQKRWRGWGKARSDRGLCWLVADRVLSPLSLLYPRCC